MKLTVLMTTYNETTEHLSRAVDSILDQTFRDFTFLIIVDNPDNKENISLIEEYSKKDSRIEFYVNEKNMGLPGSLNRGLSYIDSDYVARMDADDVAFTDRLEKELDYISNNDYDLIAANICYIDENGRVIDDNNRKKISETAVNRLIRYTDCMYHPTWMGKTELFKQLNGYRNISACEDYDFLLRAVFNEKKIGFLNETVLYYRINSKGISRSNALRQTLTTDILSKNYKNICNLTEDHIRNKVESKLTPRKIIKYQSAVKMIPEAKLQKNLYKKLIIVLKSVTVSKYILYNYRQILIKRWFINKYP